VSLRENKGETLNKAAKYRVGVKIKVLIFANLKILLWLNG